MKHNIGDEVLVKGSIVEIENDEYDACPVAVGFDKGRTEWYAEEELIPADKTYEKGLADAFLEAMRKTEEAYENESMCPSWWTAYNVVKAQPTAYDVEAVVAELEKRANDNDRAADRLSGIESKKKIASWRARAEALRDAAEIVRGKE